MQPPSLSLHTCGFVAESSVRAIESVDKGLVVLSDGEKPGLASISLASPCEREFVNGLFQCMALIDSDLVISTSFGALLLVGLRSGVVPNHFSHKNCASVATGDLVETWMEGRSGSWIPQRCRKDGFNIDEYEDEQVAIYDLKGVVSDIKTGDTASRSHLVAHIYVDDDTGWLLFNDFLVEPISANEATQFTKWKTPTVMQYIRVDLNDMIDYSKLDSAVPLDSLLTETAVLNERQDLRIMSVPLAESELPLTSEYLVAIDAEFVSLQKVTIFLRKKNEYTAYNALAPERTHNGTPASNPSSIAAHWPLLLRHARLDDSTPRGNIAGPGPLGDALFQVIIDATPDTAPTFSDGIFYLQMILPQPLADASAEELVHFQDLATRNTNNIPPLQPPS
ncbi:hypothetical protein BJ741DRAFT_583904 [Chytriomyces cf. hyalinus JEL632]|nr:hypothetical protein BJ741DRAFT_583904 [Chytriomyces cf. hyalinus JEL632]